MIPQKAEKIINAFLSVSGSSYSEDHEILRINRTELQEQSLIPKIQDLHKALKDGELGSCHFFGDISEELEINELSYEDASDQEVTFQIKKKSSNGHFFFFRAESLFAAFNKSEFTLNARKVWVADTFNSFASWTTWFVPWGHNELEPLDGWQGLDNPRKIVRDLTDSSIVPGDIRPWLLFHDREPSKSAVYDIWKIEAAKKLSRTLPLEIESNDATGIKACIKGERLTQCSYSSFTDEEWKSLFDILHRTANWVYGKSQEAESKINILNHHLSLESLTENPWPDNDSLERALTNAKQAWRLHLKENSKDLLKALTELKGSLQSEVERVNQNTRKIVNNLWRDFMIAIGVIMLRFITKSSQLPDFVFKWMIYSIFAYLIVSYSVTLYFNCRFNSISKLNRLNWRKRLYPFIDEEEYNEIVDTPIKKGLQTYREVAWFVAFLYLVIIFALEKFV